MNRSGKAFFMMFNVADGGVVVPIEFDKGSLMPDKSIIVMDEENLKVWLWHGKLRGLVPRRMALRQAESLKGHGYQAGNAIIGRGIHSLVEIDSRKVGRVPEFTEMNEQLLELLSNEFGSMGNFIYAKGAGKSDGSADPKPMKAAPKLSELKSSVKVASKPAPVRKEVQSVKAPAVVKKAAPAPKVKAAPVAAAPKIDPKTADELKKGALIIAVLDQFKDIWISRKNDGSISVEQMDGKIDAIVMTAGTGGTISGVAKYLKKHSGYQVHYNN